MDAVQFPVGIALSSDIEFRTDYVGKAFRARVRWTDPATKKRLSKSEAFDTRDEAESWIRRMETAAARGVNPRTATATLAEYGDSNLELAFRGLEPKTVSDAYSPAWRLRIKPTVGHLPVTMITGGVVDRAVTNWITDGCSKTRVKNALAAFSRVMEQAVRDELVDRNPVQAPGWQKQFARIEDELEDPRQLALRDWNALTRLTDGLVAASWGEYAGWGDVVKFEACTASRIGEVSGCRVRDINTDEWVWTVRRQTSPGPGGLADKGTKGKRARMVPLIEEVRPMITRLVADKEPDDRVFVGPRGGRIATGVLRDATHWDEVVTKLGYEHLRRHDLRHTGLTWMADAGIPLHRLQKIAGHTDPRITERYLHPDWKSLNEDGNRLTAHLRSRRGPVLKVVG